MGETGGNHGIGKRQLPDLLVRFCVWVCLGWLRRSEPTMKKTLLHTRWLMIRAEVLEAGKIVSIHRRADRNGTKMWYYERHQVYSDRDPSNGKWSKPYIHHLRSGYYPYQWAK